ncbi:histidine kinase [Polaribacter sp. PL03]|uniref:tetratricopeptide repeat-containing sensor histidine kinase n=1 Tax=Polaribacter sp. PL03 TaxID=3088353 RepID=UPI0029D0A749|nr:histidine kinase [Polaribacter sp. PL03]MDX6747049.1 histidine kinase [Polaribacter sp. PL03]
MIKITTYFICILSVLCNIGCSVKGTPKELSDKELLISVSKDNLRTALKKIDSLIKFAEYSNHQRAVLFNKKGRLLASLDKDIEAIGSLKEALFLFKKEENTQLLAETQMLLGDSYALLYKQDTAFYYTNEALTLYTEIEDEKGEAKALNSLSHLSFLKGDFLTSAAIIKKAIALQEALNIKKPLSASYNNLGFILEQTENYEEAMLYYRKAIAINKEVDRQNTSALRNLGYVHLIRNELEDCKKLYLEALIIEEETEQYLLQKEIYDVLIEASLADKDFSSVPLFIRKKDSISQLLNSYEDKEKTKLINTKYEQFVTQENLKQELELNKKNKIILGSLLGLLLVFGLFIFQKNRNSSLKLAQQKLELEQKVLRIQMNPHFIFNTLTAIQKKVFDDEPLQLMTYISKFAKLIRQNFDFVNQKEITLAEDIDALTNYIETQQFRFNNKFKYTIDIDEHIDASVVKIPPMLLQIFVENAIEHGLKPKKELGQLTINISKEKQFIKFEIIDDGIGYKAKVREEEHAIDIFKKRLKLRNLQEEKLFLIQQVKPNLGTRVTFLLNLGA